MLLYVSVMFKPLTPIITDELSHMFSEAEHIATIHAKYGSHHLEKELAASSTDNGNKNQSTVTSEEQVLIHLASGEIKYDFNLNIALQDYPSCKPFTLTSVFISKAGPPPKVS